MSNFTAWRSLVDGEEIGAIPDSVIAHYDATTESSTGGITTINDQVGPFDLTGNCTVVSNGINGNLTYEFDGSDDVMENTEISQTTPNYTIAVMRYDANIFNDAGDDGFYDTTDSSGNRRQLDLFEGSWRIFHGDSTASGGSTDNNAHLFVHEANASGTTDSLEVDGTQVASGDVGDGSIDDFALGFAGSEFCEISVGELLHYDDPSSQLISDEKTRLSDKWGITL